LFIWARVTCEKPAVPSPVEPGEGHPGIAAVGRDCAGRRRRSGCRLWRGAHLRTGLSRELGRAGQ